MTARPFAAGLTPTLLVCIATLAAAGCADTQRKQRPEESARQQQQQAPPPDPYEVAYEGGRAEAEAEVAEQRPRWLRVAESAAWDQQSGLDRETGMPWVALDPAVPATAARVAGHNETMTAYIQEYGLPAGTRKRWESELFDLTGYFTARAERERPIELRREGPAALAPEGKFALAWRDSPTAAEPTTLVFVRDGTKGSVLPPVPATRHPGKIEFLWGSPGQDVAVFRWTAPDAPQGERLGYSALDLRSGVWLRHEWGGAAPAAPGRAGIPGAPTQPSGPP